ncbi:MULTISPECIES: phosphoribosylanthranilate isomerase [unclassified Paenibacillus]|uniref:phosphoribosylanthranilate isomerase n=1 Tax=unclassified Paenibacillus TaxID=185978 RepID=UPI002405601B|nr:MULTISPECIES: phosphoribosylanthranilate isomerase [unclassified Paenibacillus]MDF9840312.1 phosphoribosylanthranilate isomerase [Paenibacillus sp. PastF-2]MDF9846894.1 phosphoribosylanthranilate isomerase [Paenibacillus sp. PastM-2]MDF9853466.1 phosphoribosylanthranilate isomerase [Paenibacillus sp. PastF-1]MDH6479047.1 phosphoribosylanthranilate isomerase [Paenibacillus sp. PastH-2]MDH6506779.1 phosphoribosylanthranilate isomerase [Paenibacillus sp. PastM-3]
MAEALVKICGLQDVEVLKSMKRLPLDYIGFVFAPSRRRVTAEQAALLAAELSGWETGKAPGAAGVFVNPELQELQELLAVVPLDVIQLHGQESPDYCREVKLAFPQAKVWKALSVAGSGQADGTGGESMVDSYAGTVDALLLDTYDPQGSGGSGRTFDWGRIPFFHQAAARHGLPLFVAGGLHPDNVGELLRDYSPDGVDVSSGVESSGVKDIAKMTSFVERVKQS